MLPSSRPTRLTALLALAALVAAVSASAARAAYSAAPDNPLSAPWGMYAPGGTNPAIDPPSAYFTRPHDKPPPPSPPPSRSRGSGGWVHTPDVGRGPSFRGGARRTAREYARTIQGNDRNAL